MSADTVVPGAGNPQALNRYAFVLNNPLKYTDPTGHRECGELPDCSDPLPHVKDLLNPVPVIPILYDANGNYDPKATWGGVSDVDMLARALLAEEGGKVFDPVASADLVGVAWVIRNRMADTGQFPHRHVYDDYTRLQEVVFGTGALSGLNNKPGNAAKVADPEAHSGNLTGDGPESARRAYWRAIAIAKGVLNGSIADPTRGATFYADAYLPRDGAGGYGPETVPYADGRTRFRNQSAGQGLSIPELQVKYGE